MSGLPSLTGDVDTGSQAADGNRIPLDLRLATELRQAQAAILARPHVSITLRLVASLALCFLLCVAFALVTMRILSQVREKQRVLAAVARVSSDVKQAVDLDRGAIPDGGGLEVARRHLDAAIAALDLEEARLSRVVGAAEVTALRVHITAARRLVADLEGAFPGGAAGATSAHAELRRRAAAARQVVDALIGRQQADLDRLLETSRRAPLVFIAVLLPLFALITAFFAQALVGPIRRFQAYTARIAAGNFDLISPSRHYRDEFSDLALAVNQMLAELQAHQDRCVRAGKLAAVGTIASGIAHELANPLNNISITTEALLEDLRSLPDDEKWKLLQDVYFETERASEIVKSLLDFTRQEKPQMVALDLGDVIRSTFRLVQNEATINNVNLVDEICPDLPPVRAAANQLRQVFLNLLLNAIQAMPKGGDIRVRVATHEAERVCAEVQDEGSGIPPEVLPHIFDPFFTTKEPGKGTGLGLSVSYSIIKKFGGDIQVRSEPGRGTVFHVCLPVATDS